MRIKINIKSNALLKLSTENNKNSIIPKIRYGPDQPRLAQKVVYPQNCNNKIMEFCDWLKLGCCCLRLIVF